MKNKKKLDNYSVDRQRIAILYDNFNGKCKFKHNEFESLSLPDQVNITQSILSQFEQTTDKTNNELRKAAYYAFFHQILSHNLNPQNTQLDFIYDEFHEDKVKNVKEIISFVRENSNVKVEDGPKKSFRKEVFSILNSSLSEIYRLGKDVALEPIKFIKSGDLRYPLLKNIDGHFNHTLNKVRYFLKSNAKERRFSNRVMQATGASFNGAVWLLKQGVNFVRKPIALSFNILKSIANVGILVKDSTTFDKEKIKKSKDRLLSILNDCKKDLNESVVAAITVFSILSMGPIISPVTAGLAGLGALGSGLATAIILTAKANSIINSTPGTIVKAGEKTLQVGQVTAQYVFTNPKSYSKDEKHAFDILFKIVKHSNDSNLRQIALEKMNKLEEVLKVEQLKRDKIGKAFHQVDKLTGIIAYKLNKYLGKYIQTTFGLGIRHPNQDQHPKKSASKR